MFWFAKIVDSDWSILIVVQFQQDFPCLVFMNNLIRCNFLNFFTSKALVTSEAVLCFSGGFYADAVKTLLPTGAQCLVHTLKYNVTQCTHIY